MIPGTATTDADTADAAGRLCNSSASTTGRELMSNQQNRNTSNSYEPAPKPRLDYSLTIEVTPL